MTDIAARLRDQVTSDHIRGCMGRQYSCSCGYDAETERLLGEAAAEIERLRAETEALHRVLTKWSDANIELEADNERLRAGLQEIEQWSRAYPLSIFPQPDLKRARELLEAGGMTLDAISADAMRHVVESVGEIARRALEPKP